MDRFDPFVKYADVYGDIINWEKDPMNKPQNQNKYFFSDGKTYYEQICKMLRLMSVFKEAFNQIYSNEDEISEAWENFVNNLSASVVEGSEPDVTLTWTDDSVNFEFTMVPGVPGEQGVGITSISFNSDYTMTITLSDGNTYTSMSLKGETGPQGPQGETGSGLQILDVYATLADLQSAHPTGQPGDAYQVGSEGNYILYIWSSSQSAWVQAGTLGTVSPYTSAPLMDGTASAGSQNLYARGDHVHPSDTSRASKEELDALIKTSQALIDQSFTYRESPAIQDGLARIDKIKGNTLVWNQLVQNGNFTSTSGWLATRGSIAVASNVLNYTIAEVGSSIQNRVQRNDVTMTNGHKYLLSVDVKADISLTCFLAFIRTGGGVTQVSSFSSTANLWKTLSVVVSNTYTSVIGYAICFDATGTSVGDVVQFRNAMVIDLTKMGLDNITSVDEFTSLFSLPYYDYNAGSLLSFMGNGIKTVGKNLLNARSTYTTNGITFTNDNGVISISGTATANAYFTTDVNLPNGSYYIGSFNDEINSNVHLAIRTAGGAYPIDMALSSRNRVTSLNNDIARLLIYVNSETTLNNFVLKPMISFDSPEYFEPYTSSTLSLPISTYFPNGMKSAGTVYDELTPRKAITRIGAVDLGTLTWTYDASVPRFYTTDINSLINKPVNDGTKANAVSMYTNTTFNQLYVTEKKNMTMAIGATGTLSIINTSYSNATAFKTAMSGVYLYYELATPTETAVDLDLSFNSYENGTEQLLPANGSVPVTSPILADMTYLSIDDAMEYIIDKLANVPLNTQQILDSLEDDVADLQEDVGALQPAVSALQTSVGNINTNIGQLSSTVAGHTASISDMQSDISDLNTGLSDLEDTVTDNTTKIGTLESGLSTTNGNVQNLETSVSDLGDTVTAQGTTVTALDDVISDISNTPVSNALGNHELGFVLASVEATLPANTGTMVTIPKPTIFPNNYTPLFIVGMQTGSYNVSICSIPNTFGSSNSVTCRVWNHGSQQTTQISVYILCMRQKQSQ